MGRSVHTTALVRMHDRLLIYRSGAKTFSVVMTTDQSAEALTQALAAHVPHHGRGATTWLIHPRMAVRTVTLPFGSATDIAAVLPQTLQQEWPTEEPYVWMVYPIDNTPETARLLVAGLPETDWHDWLAKWQAMGVDPDSVQLLGLSAWDAWHHAQPDMTGARVLVHLEHDGGMLVFGTDHMIREAYPLLAPQANQSAHWHHYLANILNELRARYGSDAAMTTLALCGTALTDELLRAIEATCRLTIRPLFHERDAIWPPLLTLLAPRSAGCDFRTGQHVSVATATQLKRRRYLQIGSVAAVVIALLSLGGFQVMDRIQRYDRLVEQSAQLAKTMIPGTRSPNPVSQAKSLVATTKQQLERLQQPPWLATQALKDLSLALPSKITLTIRELTLSPTMITIDGSVPSFAAVDDLRTALQAYPRATTITVNNTSSPQATVVTFRLLIHLDPNTTTETVS